MQVTGQAPAVVLDRTVWVYRPAGSCTVRKDTPASDPSSITASPDSWSQKPRPYRIDSDGASLRGATISATRSGDTIRPANRAVHMAWTSAAVE